MLLRGTVLVVTVVRSRRRYIWWSLPTPVDYDLIALSVGICSDMNSVLVHGNQTPVVTERN